MKDVQLDTIYEGCSGRRKTMYEGCSGRYYV